jgi:hypothetical protein
MAILSFLLLGLEATLLVMARFATVEAEICSGFKERSIGGAKFWVLIVDDYTDYCWSFVLKNDLNLKSKDQDSIN